MNPTDTYHRYTLTRAKTRKNGRLTVPAIAFDVVGYEPGETLYCVVDEDGIHYLRDDPHDEVTTDPAEERCQINLNDPEAER